MIKNTKVTAKSFTLKAVSKKTADKLSVAKDFIITEFVKENKAEMFIGDVKKYDEKKYKELVNALINKNVRSYFIDMDSFVKEGLSEEKIIWELMIADSFKFAKLYNIKTGKAKPIDTLNLFNLSKEGVAVYKKAAIVTESMAFTRNLQIMPPNVLTSVEYGKILQKEFKDVKNVKFSLLTKAQIKTNKMGLLLSVNLGSKYEPRVAVIEYTGNAKSKDKTVIVGKGITFDAGGYNIKTGPFMSNMKYDMSGSAITAGAMKAIAQLKPKTNFSVVLVLTDNMINSEASTPDAVFTSMNGKTVEINNTDAEGRLALVDGLTYAIRKLGATTVGTIATLTGALKMAVGDTYTGVWATEDKLFDRVSNAASVANEKIWRLPLHDDFLKYMKGSKVADLKNTDLTGFAGSSTAAMFLKEFSEKKPFVHFDVAYTATTRDNQPTAYMVRTLVEMAEK